MRKILLSLLLLCGYPTSALSLSQIEVPDFYYIQEQVCRGGGCFNLLADEKKISALRPKLRAVGTFEFFDSQNQRQITVRFTGLSQSKIIYLGNEYTFDIYGKNRFLIAKLRMHSSIGLVSFLSFELLSPDERIILAHGGANLPSLGARHYVFSGNSSNVIATLSRPLFTLSRDSEVTVINKQAFFSTEDPNMLAAVLALYCMHDIQMSVDLEGMSREVFHDLQNKLQTTAAAQYDKTLVVTEEQVKAATYLLHQRFRELYDETNLNEEEKIKQLIYFGCDLVQSHSLSPIEEQAILQALTNSLMNII